MAKKIQDLKPDIILKNYWNDKEQFADLFNAVLFEGKPVIKAEELEDADTEEILCTRRSACAAWFGASGTYSLCNAYEGNGI